MAAEPSNWIEREVSGVDTAPLESAGHLLEPIFDRARRDPTAVVAAHRDGPGFIDVTADEFARRVRALAKGLIASGVAPGDRVALMSHTRLEWVLLDYANLAAGAITVPIYETSAAEQVGWILTDSGAGLVAVESDEMRALVGRSSTDDEVIVIDRGGVDDLAERGEAVSDAALDERIDAIDIDDVATIVYTSGTTGRPKGCVLTHRNLRSNAIQSLDAVRALLDDAERSLLFLPLAHSFARIIALVGFEHGVKGIFATDMANLPEELAMARPTMIVAVPRVFEKVLDSARDASSQRRLGGVFDRAATIAIRFASERVDGRIRLRTRLEHAVYDRLVYARVREALGGAMRLAFSGGSPLGERLTLFFDGIGVRVFEGYGLTETGPVLTVNRADAWRPGTVGTPLSGTSLRIADDGEILAKGPQVFSGYWRDPQATDYVFTSDGWFRTGDLGTVEDGFVRITGRKKELIVTAGGKNVSPTQIEERLRAHPLISQAVVIGNDRRFIAALVTLDDEAYARWASEHGRPSGPPHDDITRAEIRRQVDEVNGVLSRAESIREFAILPTDLTIESGELTPTLKLRREIIDKRRASIIDDIYSAENRSGGQS